MEKAKLSNPYDLVKEALGCDKDSLNEDSAMINHPKWDSLSHAGVIIALEDQYGLSIPDSEMMEYDNMKAIIKLYEKVSS